MLENDTVNAALLPYQALEESVWRKDTPVQAAGPAYPSALPGNARV